MGGGYPPPPAWGQAGTPGKSVPAKVAEESPRGAEIELLILSKSGGLPALGSRRILR